MVAYQLLQRKEVHFLLSPISHTTTAHTFLSNNPYGESHHPRYTPLDRWSDARVLELRHKGITDGDGMPSDCSRLLRDSILIVVWCIGWQARVCGRATRRPRWRFSTMLRRSEDWRICACVCACKAVASDCGSIPLSRFKSHNKTTKRVAAMGFQG